MPRRAKPRRYHTHWTPAEDAQLRLLWDDGVALKTLARRLDRTANAICRRVRELGLRAGMPRDAESLVQAAKRTGYRIPTLRKILAWAGVCIRNRRTSWTKPRRFRQSFVDQLAVDDAIAAWQRTESLTRAAERAGVSQPRLTNRLRKLGIIRPVGRKGSTIRVTDEQVRAAMGVAA